jgi:poly-gamma-glutamate synthesis protein (capsule biosynthesis protein)
MLAPSRTVLSARVRLRGLSFLAVAAALVVAGCQSGPDPARPVTLAFVGDIMLGRRVEAAMVEGGNWTVPFEPLASRLGAADLTFGNLECVTARGGSARATPAFRADPRALEGLQLAGFDVVSVANNHAADLGPEALEEMLDHLGRAGIAFTGVDRGVTQAPVVLRVGDLRVGYLAFSYSAGGAAAADDPVRVAKIGGKPLVGAIIAARPLADYLVVSLHLGKEFEPRATATQRGIAHAAIDAGADLVVGHHPHVPQEVEKYRHGFVAYSLGDFVFDHPEASVHGAILEVSLREARPTRITYARTRINEQFQPELVSEQSWEGATLEGADGVLE